MASLPPGPTQTDNVYTVVRDSDGVTVALVTALTPETAKMQEQDGFTIVEGNYLGRWRMVDGKMVEADRAFEELQLKLTWKILDWFSVAGGKPIVTDMGSVGSDDFTTQLLTLGASSDHGQYFRFVNGEVRFLLHDQFAYLCGAVYNHLIDQRDKQERLLIQVKKATTREELKDLLAVYWPDEGST